LKAPMKAEPSTIKSTLRTLAARERRVSGSPSKEPSASLQYLPTDLPDDHGSPS